MDLGLSLRLAGIPLNSELNLIYDANKEVDQKVTISIQYADRPRRMADFFPEESLWTIIESLLSDCLELQDDNLLFSISYMNRLVKIESV